MIKKFDKILIANRGEIACRIVRACNDLGILTVAVYLSGEEQAPHVCAADEAFLLQGNHLSETYLNGAQIVGIAVLSGAQAIHPGYGFLSENAVFAETCLQNGLVFIGPSVEVLKLMGNKVNAKQIAKKAGVNVLTTYTVTSSQIENELTKINFPVLIKASHGGGGKGMQVVHSDEELSDKAISARRSAQNYFGNGEIYIEDYIENARHIEVQVLGDQYGNLVHLYERDCTVQRNHQKIIEEAPSACLSVDLRNQILDAALAVCREVGYQNAGTVEFLVDEKNHFYFLEMNPRIQVEHTVTEQITGVDIVKEQLHVAAGNPLSFTQDEVKVTGHAIEARLYAEDSLHDFRPSSKPITYYGFPNQQWIRLETAVDTSSSAVQFDPLLGKIIVTGIDRDNALTRLVNALDQTVVLGPATNQLHLQQILNTTAFQKNKVTTNFCQQNHTELIKEIIAAKLRIDRRFIIAASLLSLFRSPLKDEPNVWNTVGYWRLNTSIELIIDDQLLKIGFSFTPDGVFVRMNNLEFKAFIIKTKNEEHRLDIHIDGDINSFSVVKENAAKLLLNHRGMVFEISTPDLLAYYPEDYSAENNFYESDINLIKSHLHGKIVNINIKRNQTINKGDVLLVIESMKSENSITSPKKAKIKRITVEVGEQVTDQMPLVYLEDL